VPGQPGELVNDHIVDIVGVADAGAHLRWAGLVNAFSITFGDRWPVTESY